MKRDDEDRSNLASSELLEACKDARYLLELHNEREQKGFITLPILRMHEAKTVMSRLENAIKKAERK